MPVDTMPALSSQFTTESDLASRIGPLMVVSPHYDDAVFSCGRLLAAVPGSTVVTVCTALPHEEDLLTDWDSRCGFVSAADAMRARSMENLNALAILRAKGVDLDFLDDQYRPTPRATADLLNDTMLATIAEFQPASVFCPLGLFHADHVFVSDVLMTIGHHLPGIRWFAYADIPYRKQTQRVEQRLAGLTERGIHPEPMPLQAPPGRKALAVEAYRSQFLGLGEGSGAAVLQQEEEYWRLHHNPELL